MTMQPDWYHLLEIDTKIWKVDLALIKLKASETSKKIEKSKDVCLKALGLVLRSNASVINDQTQKCPESKDHTPQ